MYSTKSPISVIIPNYNGLELLKRHLPSVVRYSGSHDIVIVDDASTDDSVTWISENFPQIKIIKNSTNLGFAESVNIGFQNAKHDLVLLLNSDVSLTKNTVSALAPHMEEPKVFAVGAQETLKDGSVRGRSTGSFKRGLFVHQKGDSSKSGKTMWVFAASGLFRKSIWDKLNGMDPLFKPAYWEDIDIGYRAWKMGYQNLFEPGAKLIHAEESTMTKHLGTDKSKIVFRNQILFFWKNVTDPYLRFLHFLWFPYHLVFTSLRSNGAFLSGFIMALSMTGQIKRSPKSTLTDTQIITEINND